MSWINHKHQVNLYVHLGACTGVDTHNATTNTYTNTCTHMHTRMHTLRRRQAHLHRMHTLSNLMHHCLVVALVGIAYLP